MADGGGLPAGYCGSKTYHDPHEFTAVGFLSLVASNAWCDGLRDQAMIIRGLRQWTQVRDEVIPALQRTFPGVIVTGDERVVRSSIPDPEWHGAELTLLGLDPHGAAMIEGALIHEFGREVGDDLELRNVTEAEAVAVAAHRSNRQRHATSDGSGS